MKLKDCRDSYYDYSKKASEILRYLGFAGIALIWMFRVEKAGVTTVPVALVWPAILLVSGLTLDLFQYVYGTIAWGTYHRMMEKRDTPEDKEFEAPRWLNWPTNAFFTLKIPAIAVAYILLLNFLFGKLQG